MVLDDCVRHLERLHKFNENTGDSPRNVNFVKILFYHLLRIILCIIYFSCLLLSLTLIAV